jgi:ankyrin repeat protein
MKFFFFNFQAAQQGNLGILNALIAAGADLNLQDANGITALGYGKKRN